MAKFVLHNTRIFAGAADLTGVSNAVELSSEVEDKEVTSFNATPGEPAWKEFLGGLASTKLSGEGQWEALHAGKVDNAHWANLGAAGPWTFCPVSAAEGQLSYFTNALTKSYDFGGAIGDVAPWKAEAAGTWPLVRGVSVHNPGTLRTATGTGTAVQHVAVPTGKSLYAAIHIVSSSGTSPMLTASIESDDSAGFASPTTRVTFAAASGGSQILRTVGPITDNWYRVSFTISGTTPQFLFVCVLGVA